MPAIEFETPTLNDKGEIIAWKRYAAEQFTEDLGSDVRLDLLVIPAGVFQMGSTRQFGGPDEQPQHLVTVKSFMMSKLLTTQRQWKAVIGKLPPCRFKGDHLPVERVSWLEAQKFCQQLSKRQVGIITYRVRHSGNMPVGQEPSPLTVLAKQLQ